MLKVGTYSITHQNTCIFIYHVSGLKRSTSCLKCRNVRLDRVLFNFDSAGTGVDSVA
jgi:hypothetical protein